MKSLKKYPPVVIAGLNDASMSLVRSLGRKGIQIIGLYDDHTHSYYQSSKYISQKVKSNLWGKALVETLIHRVSKNMNEPPVLFCTNDHSVLTVSQYSAELIKLFKFVLPPYDVVFNQISKREFSKFALENSFLIPKTVFLDASSDIEPIMQDILFPCIIKPEFRDQKWNEKIPVKVLYAESKEDFSNFIDQYQLKQFSLIIQEWIEGGDSEVYFCLVYLNRAGEPLAICTGRKLRQHPYLTGSTSLAETVHLPEITQESLRLLKTAGCIGFCSVEFKKSSKDGRLYITEPTIGRPDTQEGICLGAGIDISYIAYLDALEKTPEPAAEVKKYIKWINEPLEFYCFQDQWRNGFRLSQFMSSYKGERSYSLWSPDDPGPMFAFTKEKLSKGIAKLSKHR
jgi:D-aspartate ligase